MGSSETYDYLSDIDKSVFVKLDLLKEMQRAKQDDPFYELERLVYEKSTNYFRKNRDRPTKVFMGFKQYEAFNHIPPWMISYKQATTGVYHMQGMEVIQVIKDDFLEVI